jgi:hypothetical protein
VLEHAERRFGGQGVADAERGRELAGIADLLELRDQVGKRRAGAEEADAGARLRLARDSRRRLAGGQVDPVRGLGLVLAREQELRGRAGDHLLGELDLVREQAVGGAGAEHRHAQELLLGGRLGRHPGVDGHFRARVLARLGEGVDPADHSPDPLVERAVAEIEPLELRREASERAHQEQRDGALEGVAALHAGRVRVEAGDVAERRRLPERVDDAPVLGFLQLALARGTEVLAGELPGGDLAGLVEKLHELGAEFGLE